MGNVIAVSANKGGVLKTSLSTNIAGVLSRDLLLEDPSKKIEKDNLLKELSSLKKSRKNSKKRKRIKEIETNIEEYENEPKELLRKGKKILIIDHDNQGNVALSFGINPDDYGKTLYNVLVEDMEMKEAIVNVHENIDLVISNDDMIDFSVKVLTNIDKYPNYLTLLKEKIDSIKGEYDYVIIDTPPDLGLVISNVFTASDKILVPFQPETFSMRSLIKTIGTVESFKEMINPNVEILGIVPTLIDSRTTIHSDILQECRKYAYENDVKVFDTHIPRSVRFASSVAYEGKPSTLSKQKNDNAVQSYFELVKELGL